MSLVPVRLAGLPLRLRLVAGFSAATLVALVVAGSFVYWRVEYALDRGLDTELTEATRTIEPLVGTDGNVTNRPLAEATDGTWQVLDRSGRVLDHGTTATASPMISARRLARADGAPLTYNKGDLLPISAEPYRVRVSPLRSSNSYVLVAVRRDHRDEALRELVVQLALAGAAMLLFSAFVGERLARASLRPVERYRQRAAAIASGAADLRLDVPAGPEDEVTRLGHTFNQMLASLEQGMDRERAFVNEASHELRTPITLLTSRVQFARRRRRTVEEHEAILAELDIDLARLADLAEHLLHVGAAGDSTPAARSDVVAVARRVAEQRHVSADLASDSIHVALADVDVERILTNLIDNAKTHGAAPVALRIDTPSSGWARIAVTDQGDGMPADLLRTATRRFARAETARSRAGSGLGLSLIEALAVRVGGEVRLCHNGEHASHGGESPVVCDHDPAMTVTVFLPSSLE